MVKRIGWLLVVVGFCAAPSARAHIVSRPFKLDRYNRKIHGKVLDYTRNHGKDQRLNFPSLCKKRDMYVYVPPGYDPCKRYPMGIYLHGFLSDELSFLQDVVKPIDDAIACGIMPPVILVAPDASVHGLNCMATYGSFYSNTRLGRFEDYIVCDVYNWAMKTFPIRPEAEAHFLLGVSMGGHGAFSKAFKHPDKFRVVVGVLPPLNMLYSSCHGKYMDKFDPNCWIQREGAGRPREVVARFFHVITIHEGHLTIPMYGRNNPQASELVKQDNPFDLLDSRNVQPGDFELFIAYAGKDEFNIDAQVESFLYRARQKCIPITVKYLPDGHHNTKTGRKFLPDIVKWLGEKLGAYHPDRVGQ